MKIASAGPAPVREFATSSPRHGRAIAHSPSPPERLKMVLVLMNQARMARGRGQFSKKGIKTHNICG
jgi:hypothetical protein